jgi:hypothetical protein
VLLDGLEDKDSRADKGDRDSTVDRGSTTDKELDEPLLLLPRKK